MTAGSQIRRAPHPGAAKALGRQVGGFDERRWADRRFGLVVAANMAEFGQHAELREFLLSTGRRVLAEASPQDRIWGRGLTDAKPRAGAAGRASGKSGTGYDQNVPHPSALPADGGDAPLRLVQSFASTLSADPDVNLLSTREDAAGWPAPSSWPAPPEPATPTS